MSDLTRLLDAASTGNPKAAAELLPLVYEELRVLAAARLAGEKSGATLQPTALVHEAYLRLVGPADEPRWDDRRHFFSAAAQAMRRILIDAARRKRAHKHGGGRQRAAVDCDALTAPEPGLDLVALDAALVRLAERDPLKSRLVELRYFGGLTGEQAAAVLGISPSSADRQWVFTRAWLRREMALCVEP